MLANNIWKLTGEFFEKVLFAPYDALRLGTDSWWSSNIVSFFFMATGFVMFMYWMKLMRSYKRSGKEDEA
jgi:hypothetical protein